MHLHASRSVAEHSHHTYLFVDRQTELSREAARQYALTAHLQRHTARRALSRLLLRTAAGMRTVALRIAPT